MFAAAAVLAAVFAAAAVLAAVFAAATVLAARCPAPIAMRSKPFLPGPAKGVGGPSVAPCACFPARP